MKIQIQTPESMANPVEKLNRLTAQKTALPILSHLVIECPHDNRVTLTATDMETEITLTMPATSPAGLAMTCDAGKLINILKTISTPLTLEKSENDYIALQAERVRWRMRTFPPSEYPTLDLPDYKPKLTATLDQGDLKTAMGKILYAMAKKDTRYTLLGCLIESAPDGLHLVATDGLRLASTFLDVNHDGAGPPVQAILSARAAKALMGLLTQGDPCTLTITDSTATLSLGDGNRFCTRLIDGKYPDWRRVIPADYPTRVEIARDTLTPPITRIGLFETDGLKMALAHIHTGGIRITPLNPREDAEEDVTAQVGGPPVSIGFNIDYLSSALGATHSDSIRIEFSHPTRAFRITDPGDPDTLHLIMPARL